MLMGTGFLPGDDENIMKLVMINVHLCEYMKNHLTAPSKNVNVMVCVLNLNKQKIRLKNIQMQIWSQSLQWQL